VTGSHRAMETPAQRRRNRPWRRLGLVVGLLCLPLTAAVVVLVMREQDALDAQHARAEAMTAAVHAAGDVLSYDYRTLDHDVARAQADATGLFARQYRQTADSLKKQAAKNRAIVQATPGTPGVVTASADEVVVLVFVDQASVHQFPGSKAPTTRIDQSRVRMTMTRVGDKWLVSQLAAL